MGLGYNVIDADSHYYEPDDCFTRHIESSTPIAPYASFVARVHMHAFT
jgi:hypothetical protein